MTRHRRVVCGLGRERQVAGRGKRKSSRAGREAELVDKVDVFGDDKVGKFSVRWPQALFQKHERRGDFDRDVLRKAESATNFPETDKMMVAHKEAWGWGWGEGRSADR